MNYKKTLLTTSIIAILTGVTQANDYISIITQEKHVYDIVENSDPVATEWVDKGSEFNCLKEFSTYDYPLGQAFTQNENCLQKQERVVTTTEIFNGTPRTTAKIEYQNIPVVISYLETGKENYNTGAQRNKFSAWLDDGSHYACGDFNPLVSTVNLGESFNQNRSCSQAQDRTKTVYDIWADGSETIASTNIETRILTELEYNAAIGTKNFTTGSQRTEYTNWLDSGSYYACSIFIPLVSTVNLGESFTQNRDCSQDQERTKTVYDIWATGSETLASTNIENQTLTENETQNVIGTKNFNTGATRIEYTNWLDDGIHYSCDTFMPLVSSVNLGESFTQNRDCSQDQERTKTVYDIWATGSETVKSTDIESQILTENETQNSIGTKNYDTGINETTYTNWIDTGVHYSCATFSPLVSTINLGDSFTQNRDCSQDQERTKTIKSVWANGTKTIDLNTIETKTLTENETQNAVGTKNFLTGEQNTNYTNWLDDGTHYDCENFSPLVSTINLGESFTQNRDCSQDQNRTKTISNVWAEGADTVVSTTIETQTLTENESQNASGTKNFDTGTKETTYTNWLDTGGFHSCETYLPYRNTVNLGSAMTQYRDCSQDQNRTKTVKSIWADGSKTVDSNNVEVQTVIENTHRNTTGTKNYDTGTNETTYTSWTDTGGLHSCGVYAPAQDTVRLGNALTQYRDCSQNQDRIRTIKSVWADGSKTLDSNTTEIKTVIENKHRNTTGTGLATSCKVILDKGWSNGSGVYTLDLPSGNKNVTCDMNTAGGGWTVLQSRISNTDFYKTWAEYKNGFGSGSNFWLGNDTISEMTVGNKELYVELGHHDGNVYNARYSTFNMANETNKYRLSLAGYSGTVADSLLGHNGMSFTTKDNDNDTHTGNCANSYSGAWWYSKCHSSNLNGLYLDGDHATYANGMNWYHGHGHYYSYKTTKMMFR